MDMLGRQPLGRLEGEEDDAVAGRRAQVHGATIPVVVRGIPPEKGQSWLSPSTALPRCRPPSHAIENLNASGRPHVTPRSTPVTISGMPVPLGLREKSMMEPSLAAPLMDGVGS